MSTILMPGNPTRAKLDKLQAKIAELQREIKAIEKLPASLEDVRAEAMRSIDRFAHRHPMLSIEVSPELAGDAKAEASHVLALLLGVVGADALADAIVRSRGAMLDSAGKQPGPTRAERAKRIAEIREQIARLAVDEEREVLRLESMGHQIIRRADIDGRIAVAVWMETFGAGEPARPQAPARSGPPKDHPPKQAALVRMPEA